MPTIVRDPADRVAGAGPVTWALEQLQQALAARGLDVRRRDRLDDAPPGDACVVAAGGASAAAREVLNRAGAALPGVPEALALVPGHLAGRPVTLAAGSDVRGLVYAVLELADRVAHAGDAEAAAAALRLSRPAVERPANAIRSIARLFTSDVEDKPWFYDWDDRGSTAQGGGAREGFWPRYLSMLAAQRFNRFSLTLGLGYNFPRRVTDVYFYFAYPFLLDVPGFDVRAQGLPDAERDRNLATLRSIGEATKARGLHFQLGLWTHAYEWLDSPDANYVIEGLTPDNHAAYCRRAVRRLLEACPAIDGLTFRIHGESGVPEGSYDFWREVFAGITDAGRPVEIDMHAKGIDRRMIDVALETGLPVVVSPKYWAEHMGLPYHQAAIREVERPAREPSGENRGFMALSGGSRRHTRYGYTDLLTEDRRYGVLFRIWPGTQRLLLWGDPAAAAGYGRASSFAGCQGVELCEPLSFKGRMGSGHPGGRAGYADASLRPAGGETGNTGDWEKYAYTYRVWGRLIYNPETDPDAWRRHLRREFGPAAEAAEQALANASRILLLVTTAYHPSASNNRYWPELYTNMPIVSTGESGAAGEETRPHPYGDTPAPRRFGTASALDPELFSRVEDFAGEVVRQERSGKYSPLAVARWLEGFATAAEQHLAAAQARAADPSAPAFRRWAVDVAIQAALGRFFAEKLRAGVAYALYQRMLDAGWLREAVERYRAARAAWAAAAEHGRVYRDDLTFGRERFLRGHWADRLAAIDQDIQDMEAALDEAVRDDRRPGSPARVPAPPPVRGAGPPVRGAGTTDDRNRRNLESLEPERPAVRLEHTAPASFRRGEPVPIQLAVRDAGGARGPVGVRLRYRHVNQAETYRVADMEAAGQGRDAAVYQATIPGEYTDSAYPLEYFFELRGGTGTAWLYPGFNAELSNQPYFLLRQASSS